MVLTQWINWFAFILNLHMRDRAARPNSHRLWPWWSRSIRMGRCSACTNAAKRRWPVGRRSLRARPQRNGLDLLVTVGCKSQQQETSRRCRALHLGVEAGFIFILFFGVEIPIWSKNKSQESAEWELREFLVILLVCWNLNITGYKQYPSLGLQHLKKPSRKMP